MGNYVQTASGWTWDPNAADSAQATAAKQADAQLQAQYQVSRDATNAYQRGQISEAQLNQVQAQVQAGLQKYSAVTRNQSAAPATRPAMTLSQAGEMPTGGGEPRPGTVPAGTNGTPFLNYGTPGSQQFYGGPYRIPPELLAQWGVPPGGNPAAPGAGAPMANGVPVNSTRPYQYSMPTGGLQPSPATGADAAPATRPLRVRMPDGTFKDFTGDYWTNPDLDAALKAHGVPIDPVDGSDMSVTSGVYGNGYLFNGLPINIIAGRGFVPGQEETLTNLYAVGYKPGGAMLANPPALPQSAQQYYPGGSGQSGSPFDFGYLAQPFTEEFKGPGNAPGAFKFDASEAANDPGYQFALDEGLKAVQRAQSAGMRLSSGRALKEADRYATDYATTKVNDVFNRDLAEHTTATTDYNNEWNRQMQEFGQRFNIDNINKTNIFNRFSTLAGGGQVAANSLAAAGTAFGNATGGNIIDSTVYGNAAELAAARARAQAANNVSASVYSIPGARTSSLGDARI